MSVWTKEAQRNAGIREGKLRGQPREVKVFENITREYKRCTGCGFNAMYVFLRCPECNVLQ